jgi:hypothetical protein
MRIDRRGFLRNAGGAALGVATAASLGESSARA